MTSKINAVGFSGVWRSREGSYEVILAFQAILRVKVAFSNTRKFVLVNETWRYTDGFGTTAEMGSGHVTCAFPNVASAQLYQHFKSIDSSYSFLACNKYQTDHPTVTTGTDGFRGDAAAV
jgi:hypothetical protein